MWERIFNLALSNGIWSVLFLILLFFQLRDSKAREEKYQQTIESLGNSLEIVKSVKDDVEEIKTTLSKITPDQKNNTRGEKNER